MKLNKIEPRTTNNFKINDIDLDINIPSIDNFKAYNIISDEYDKLKVNINTIDKELTNKIGLVYDKYTEVNIIVPKDIKLNEPVIFTYKFENNDVLIDKINIIYEENSSVDFIFKYESIDNGNHFHSLTTNIISNSYSNGSVTYINKLNNNSYNLIAIENELNNHSSIKQNIIDMGGNTRLYNVYTNTLDYSNNILNTVYIGKDNNIIDINYYLNNKGIKSSNKMLVQGVLNDNSKKNFRGTLDFIKGASKSIGEELENCVLLSDTCISRSLPMMLCNEEDVVGSHGVSSGKIDSNKLYYLNTRGLNKKEAEKFIIKSNFNTIIEQIPSVDIRNEIIDIIDNTI